MNSQSAAQKQQEFVISQSVPQQEQESKNNQSVSQEQQESMNSQLVAQKQESTISQSAAQKQQEYVISQTVAQEQQKSVTSQSESHKITIEIQRSRNQPSFTMLQEPQNCHESLHIQSSQYRQDCCTLGGAQVTTTNGTSLLPIISNHISTNRPEENINHQNAKRKFIKTENDPACTRQTCFQNTKLLPEMNEQRHHKTQDPPPNVSLQEQLKSPVELNEMNKAKRLVKPEKEVIQHTEQNLKNGLVKKTNGKSQEAHIADSVDWRSLFQQPRTGVRHLQAVEMSTSKQNQPSPSQRVGQRGIEGRKCSRKQRIKVKKKKKRRQHTRSETKVHSEHLPDECQMLHISPTVRRHWSVKTPVVNSSAGTLCDWSLGQASSTPVTGSLHDPGVEVRKKTLTGRSESLSLSWLGLDGIHSTQSRIWERDATDMPRHQFSEANQGTGKLQAGLSLVPPVWVSEVNHNDRQSASSHQSEDPRDGYCPSPVADDSRATSKVPHSELEPGENTQDSTIEYATSKVLDSYLCSCNLTTEERQMKFQTIDDRGLILKHQPKYLTNDSKFQKELQNSLMREMHSSQEKSVRQEENESRTHLVCSWIVSNCSQSPELESASSVASTYRHNHSDSLQVGSSISDVVKQPTNEQVNPEQSQESSEKISVEKDRCGELALDIDRPADIQGNTLSWPFPVFSRLSPSVEQWNRQNKMKCFPENALPVKVDSNSSRKTLKISKKPDLELGRTVRESSDIMRRNDETVLTEVWGNPDVAILGEAVRKLLAENRELRDKMELLQFELTEQTLPWQPERQHQAPEAGNLEGRRRPPVSTERHSKLSLLKYAGALKNSASCLRQIASLKSKVADDGLLIRDLNSQVTVLRDKLANESHKVNRAHLKILRLKKLIKEYKYKTGPLKPQGQIPMTHTPLEVGATLWTHAANLGEGDCIDMEPPAKKMRLMSGCDGYPIAETAAAFQPQVFESEINRKPQQQLCFTVRDDPSNVEHLSLVGKQQMASDIAALPNSPLQHSTSGVARDSAVSTCCQRSGFASAFDPTQQTGRQRASINVCSSCHLKPTVTHCHHNMVASRICPSGSHTDCLPPTHQRHSGVCCPAHALTRGSQSIEYPRLGESSISFPAAHRCCCFPRSHQTKKLPRSIACDLLASTSSPCANQQRPNSVATRRPQCSAISCNNSRNKSRESSTSDCQHISPLPSPSLLPVPAVCNYWPGHRHTTSPRNEVAVDWHSYAGSPNSKQQGYNSFVQTFSPTQHRYKGYVQSSSPKHEHNKRYVQSPSPKHEHNKRYVQYPSPKHEHNKRYVQSPCPKQQRYKSFVQNFSPKQQRYKSYVRSPSPKHEHNKRYVQSPGPGHENNKRYVQTPGPKHEHNTRYVRSTGPSNEQNKRCVQSPGSRHEQNNRYVRSPSPRQQRNERSVKTPSSRQQLHTGHALSSSRQKPATKSDVQSNFGPRWTRSYIGPLTQPYNHIAGLIPRSGAAKGWCDSSLYWPCKPAEESQSYLQACAMYSLQDAGVARKVYPRKQPAGSKAKACPASCHISETSKQISEGKEHLFAYASGATVCPERQTAGDVSKNASKVLQDADNEGGNINRLLGIFTPMQHVRHHGQATTANLQTESAQPTSEKDVLRDSLYSHFQTCFLSHLVKDDSDKLQQIQLQPPNYPTPEEHTPCQQRDSEEKPNQTPRQSQRVYKYHRMPLSLPPSELPYPPLSPFHHNTTTQARKNNAQMMSDTDLRHHSSNILSEPGLLEAVPRPAFHDAYRHLGERVMGAPIADTMKSDDCFAVRSFLENRSHGEHPRPMVNLRARNLRHVLNESAFLASEALVDKRQIEASASCQFSPRK